MAAAWVAWGRVGWLWGRVRGLVVGWRRRVLRLWWGRVHHWLAVGLLRVVVVVLGVMGRRWRMVLGVGRGVIAWGRLVVGGWRVAGRRVARRLVALGGLVVLGLLVAAVMVGWLVRV